MLTDGLTLPVLLSIGVGLPAFTHNLARIYYSKYLYHKPKRPTELTRDGKLFKQAILEYNRRYELFFCEGISAHNGWKRFTTKDFLDAYPETQTLEETAIGRLTLCSLHKYQPSFCVAKNKKIFQKSSSDYDKRTQAAFSYPCNAVFINPSIRLSGLNEVLVHEMGHCEQDHLSFGLYTQLFRQSRLADLVLISLLQEAGSNVREAVFKKQSRAGNKNKTNIPPADDIPPAEWYDGKIASSLKDLLKPQIEDILIDYTPRLRWFGAKKKPDFSITPLSCKDICVAAAGSLYPPDTVLKQTADAIGALQNNIETKTRRYFLEKHL